MTEHAIIYSLLIDSMIGPKQRMQEGARIVTP